MAGDGPARRIPIPDWMTPASLQHLLDTLGDCRFVGGAPRDTLLGRPVGDLDLATPLLPEEVIDRLGQAGFRVIPTGLAHGTVTAILPSGPVEITTLRRDIATDGRHAAVAFTDDWAADAARRDFTMNALYLNRTGGIWDPLGHGIDDCLAGIVRFVGAPGARIDEDFLRILRLYRFQAHYGRTPIERETRLACCRRAGKLSRLSGERIRVELLKLLQAPAPVPALTALAQDGVWRKIGLPEPMMLNQLSRLIRVEPEIDPLRRFASLLRADPGRAATRLRFSNAQRARLDLMMTGDIPAPEAPASDHHNALFKLGSDVYRDLALLSVARGRDPGALGGQIAAAQSWPIPRLPVRGADLLTLGLKPGPAVSATLKSVEIWWAGSDFVPNRAACLEKAKNLIENQYPINLNLL